MSGNLYHMLHGFNPGMLHALAIVDIDPSRIPRFRDAYFDWADHAQTIPIIVILTRTGGDNRVEYADHNRYMTEVPGYIADRDDEFDTTFALFSYTVADDCLETAKMILAKLGKPLTLRQLTDAAVKRISETMPRRP